jgi:hypothetical protein
MAAFETVILFENNNFIANYVNQINSSAAKAFFGGLIYSNTNRIIINYYDGSLGKQRIHSFI